MEPVPENLDEIRMPHPFQGNVDKVSVLVATGVPLAVAHHPHPRKSAGRVVIVWRQDMQGTWSNGSPSGGFIVGEALTYQGAEKLTGEWLTRIGQK